MNLIDHFYRKRFVGHILSSIICVVKEQAFTVAVTCWQRRSTQYLTDHQQDEIEDGDQDNGVRGAAEVLF